MYFMRGIYEKIIKLPGWIHAALLTIIFIAITVTTGIYLDRMEVYKYMSTDLNPKIGLIQSWAQWDTHHYQDITDHGYKIDSPEKMPFFPLYPLVTGVFKNMLNISTPLAQLLTSWIFLVLGVIVLYYWLKFEIKARKLRTSPYFVLFLMAIFPTSFFFCAGYTESLFLFLTVGSIYAYRKEKYILSGILIALSTATKVQGGVLAIFYLLDFLVTYKKSHNFKKIIPVIMSPIGIGSYMIFLWVNFNDPFFFVTAQTLYNRLGGDFIASFADSMEPRYLWYLPVIALGLTAVYKYLGKLWFIYCLSYVLLPLASGRFDSLNRYILPLAPMFLALGAFLDRVPVWAKYVFIVTSAFLLAINLLFYVNTYWVA